MTESENQNNDPLEKRKVSRRKFLTLAGAGGAALVGCGTLGYTFFVEPFWVKIRKLNIALPNVPPNWVGKTIMQISDLHIGQTVSADYLIRVLKESQQLKPDLIVITGDVTDSHVLNSSVENDAAVKILQHLPKASQGTAMIMGNHDYGVNWSDTGRADDLDRKLTAAGIDVLRNRQIEYDGLVVGGMDDLWSPNFDAGEIGRNIDLSRTHIALVHNPDVCDISMWFRFQGLILSGHTHGGQCKPPFLPPPILPVMNKKYTRGHFQLDDKRQLYINPGLGYLRPIRFNVRPEITLFTLKKDVA